MAYCGKNFIKPCSATHAVKSMKMNFINLSISFKASTSNGKQRNYSITGGERLNAIWVSFVTHDVTHNKKWAAPSVDLVDQVP